MRRLSFPVLAVAAMAFVAPMAMAQVSISVQVPGIVQVAPPPPRMERMPSIAPDHVWVPGNWQWHDGRYIWRNGHTVVARPDYMYAPGQWVAADGGWRWNEGGWKQKGGKHTRHDDGPQGHCPPGQAKKGRC